MLTDKQTSLKDTNTGASSQFTPQSKAMDHHVHARHVPHVGQLWGEFYF